MARFPLNFAQIEDKSFPVYPPGTYVLRIAEARMETAKSSQELKETINFEIVNGPNGSPDHAGKKIFANYSLQSQAGFRMKRLLNACGVPPEQMADLDDQDLVGRTIKAQITVEPYQGKPTNRVGNEEPFAGNGATAAAAPSFPSPQNFSAPPTGSVPAPGPGNTVGFVPPPSSGQWAPAWNAAGGPPPPPKPVK